MIDIIGFQISAKFFFHIMVSFAFFVGVILMASPEAFATLNRALQKEYGIKTRLVPTLENTSIDVVDKAVIRSRVLGGMAIAVASFALLLLFK